MQIQVSKLTDVSLLRKACGFTIDRESKIGLDSIYRCEHSPARTQMFCVEMRDIATFVSVHLVRHKIGVEHFVKSNREDRLGYSGDLGRQQPVNHMMIANAQALIQMARKRLCSQAHIATQEVMEAIKQEVAKVDPDLARYMVPECEYRNGYCPELKPCGRNHQKVNSAASIMPTVEEVAASTEKIIKTMEEARKATGNSTLVFGDNPLPRTFIPHDDEPQCSHVPFIFPACQRFMGALPGEVVKKLREEVNEVEEAYKLPYTTDLLMELYDVVHVAETAIRAICEKAKIDPMTVKAQVIQKNRLRKYYEPCGYTPAPSSLLDCAGIRCDQCGDKANCTVK